MSWPGVTPVKCLTVLLLTMGMTMGDQETFIDQEVREHFRPLSRVVASYGMDSGFREAGIHPVIHVAHVLPGREYEIGLDVRSDDVLAGRLRVRVCDRWPQEPDACRHDLPTAPALRDRDGGIDYRWRIGISPDSPGNLLYILIEATPPAGQSGSGLRYRLELIESPRLPMDRVGRGRTHLDGPRDLELVDGAPEQAVVWVETRSRDDDIEAVSAIRDGRNLIRNGDFQDGLDHWVIDDSEVDAAVVAVGADGLKMLGGRHPVSVRLQQRLQAYVPDGGRLHLSAVFRIRQRPEFRGVRHRARFSIRIDYQDANGQEHHGADAWRMQFTAPGFGEGRHLRRVPGNAWFELEESLRDFRAAPRVIHRIHVEGRDLQAAEVELRHVALLVE